MRWLIRTIWRRSGFLDKVGIKNVIEFARTVGITSPLPADLSLGLGSSSVGLMELTSVYGVFLNQGSRVEPFAIKSVKDNLGKTLEVAEPEPHEVIAKETAYLITNMMEDVVQKGTGQAAKVLGRPIAGKTGRPTNISMPGLSAARQIWSRASMSDSTIAARSERVRRAPVRPCRSGSRS